MSAEYTPGPWEIFVIQSPLGKSFRIFAPPFEDKVEAIDIAHIPMDWNGEANARLIAAAPDLLSIAKRWRALDVGAWHLDRHKTEKAELLKETAAAIKKATGESS